MTYSIFVILFGSLILIKNIAARLVCSLPVSIVSAASSIGTVENPPKKLTKGWIG